MDLPFLLYGERQRCEIKVHAIKKGILGRQKKIITNEVIHASILKIAGPNPFFITALTPYPTTSYIRLSMHPPFIIHGKGLDARYENPSILFSKDGIHWVENIQNPVFPPPKNAKRGHGPHNCDPCLLWNSKNDKAFLFFSNWGNGVKNIRLLMSDNFFSWIDVGPTNVEITNGSYVRVSPSVIYEDREDKFYMLLIQADLSKKEKPFLVLFQSTDGLYWIKRNESDLSTTLNGIKFYPWHISCRKVGQEYWMLSSMNQGHLYKPPMYLFFCKTIDLIDWQVCNRPVLKPTNEQLDEKMIYHGDFIVENNHLNLWFSSISVKNECSIYFIRGRLKEKLNYDVRSNNIIRSLYG
jgi:hypothetical protein